MAAEYQLTCQSTSVGRVLVNMLANILANSWPRVGKHVSWENTSSGRWPLSGGLNKSEWLTTKKDSRCCRKVAIVESWLLVYYRLDYIIYIIRDFKIQRHTNNKNIA